MSDAIGCKDARRTAACRAGFAADTRGAAAIEFGLVGGMFIVLICFWIEIGLSLFMQSALDRAVRKEARLIRIGQIGPADASTFSANLCGDLQFLMTCANLQFNVVAASSFSALSATVTANASGRMTTTGFAPGTSGQDVVVQVGYTRTLFFPIVKAFLGTNGALLTSSTLVFQNEPF